MPSSEPPGDVSPDDSVDEVPGIGSARRETLEANGLETVEDLQRADLSDLLDHLPDNVAREAKETVGDTVETITTAAEARERASKRPGAKAKVVKGPDGRQRPKVLDKSEEQQLAGATVEIHKG